MIHLPPRLLLIRVLCSWCLWAAFSSIGYTQRSDNAIRIDSLLAILEEYKALDEQKVDMLNQLGFEYWIVDPNKSEVYAEQALEIAKILPYDKGLAFANRIIGVAHWVRGNPDLSFRFLMDAERGYRSINDSLGLANSMLNLGMAYADQLNYKAALAKYQQALQLFNELDKSSRVATTYTKIGELLTQQGDYDQAYTYLTDALDIHRTNDFLYGIAEANSKLGKLFIARNDYAGAISYLLLAIEASRERNDHVGMAEAYHEIAVCFFRRDDLPQAEYYLDLSRGLAEDFDLNKARRNVYQTAKDIAVQKGNYQDAIAYYDQYLNVRDSLFNEEKSNIIANMQAQQAYEDKEQELTMAQQRLDLLVAEKKTDRLTVLALVLGLFAILALTWGIIQRKNKVLSQRQQDLDQALDRTDELHTLIQNKEKQLTSYTLNFVQKNELITDLKQSINQLKKNLRGAHRTQLDGVVRQLDGVLRVDEDWADFRKHFEAVHPQLMQRLNQDFPSLTKNEFRLIALLRLNLNSKEMSAVLGISPDSVKTARYRLRKKLGLESQEELFDFLLRYEDNSTHS